LNLDLTNIVLYHALVVLGEVMIILSLVHMLYNRRSSTSIIAWLLFIILVPYVAVVLYFVFGSRKRKNRYKKDKIKLQEHTETFIDLNPINEVLRSYDIAETCKNENFVLYTDSVTAYKELMKCISNTKKSIHISTYVFKYDDVTDILIKELLKKADEGVSIRILIDSLGSLKLYIFGHPLKKLINSGVKIEFFMPIFKMPFRNYINLRNHRKIWIFDNEKVLSGGMNLANEYIGPKQSKPRWDDILFLVEGKSAELYFEIFASDWFYASHETLNFPDKPIDTNGDTSLQVVPSGPDMDKDVLYGTLLCAIYGAKKRIWLVTPYFVPDASLLQALIMAKHKGLDIKLITPKKSNHLIADLARSSYMRELEEAGVEVILHDGLMLHAKAILFDETSVMLGSVNIDNRSLFLNYEVATFVYSFRVVKEVEIWMQKLILNSHMGTEKVSRIRIVIENLMKVLAPQI